jgi:predicted lipoprotein with Yx(FWY)xxD motif
MKRLLLFTLAAASLVAGCGSGSGSDSATNVTAAAAAGAAANRDAMKDEEAMKGDDAMKDEEAMKGDDAMKGDAHMERGDAMKQQGTKLKVVDSEFGAVVANGRGEALYLFDREQRGKSECYGACAEAWPPVLTKGKPRAVAAADPSLLGTTKRRNGKLQVTYGGQPLYYYVGDSPGTILCHDVDEFGGTWLVVQPDGRPAP